MTFKTKEEFLDHLKHLSSPMIQIHPDFDANSVKLFHQQIKHCQYSSQKSGSDPK